MVKEKEFTSIKKMADYIFNSNNNYITIAVYNNNFVVYLGSYDHYFTLGNQDHWAEIGINRMGNDIHEIYHLTDFTPSQLKILKKIEDEILFWGEINYIKL